MSGWSENGGKIYTYTGGTMLKNKERPKSREEGTT